MAADFDAEVETLGERLGGGRMAEVFEFGEEQVIKLLRPEWSETSLDAEIAAQRAASNAGIPAPAVFGERTVAGRRGIVMERVRGLDGLTAIDRKPWRVWAVGSMVGVLHRELSRVAAPAGPPSLKEITEERVSNSPHVPDVARARLLRILGQLPSGDRICHMDFHPGNIIEGETGSRIIDFANAMSGDPMADYAKSLILLKAGEAPPGTTAWARTLIRLGRGLAARAYRSGYGPLTAEEHQRLLLWQPLIIAVRLDEAIVEERARMLRMLSRSLRAAETVSP
jgi:Ser/Thr protein kinase RdoA (MazF antagonist)